MCVHGTAAASADDALRRTDIHPATHALAARSHTFPEKGKPYIVCAPRARAHERKFLQTIYSSCWADDGCGGAKLFEHVAYSTKTRSGRRRVVKSFHQRQKPDGGKFFF